MKPNTNFFVALCGVMLMLAEPALARPCCINHRTSAEYPYP